MEQPIDDLYEIKKQIGQGSYAKVYKAINRHTGKLCAIKKMPVNSIDMNKFILEVGILKVCNCKNIVRFLGHYSSDQEASIVMEHCAGGSVKDVMRQLGKTLTPEQIILIVHDALNGLKYLHSLEKIHRDVKAANILLNIEGVAKLGDFGVSEKIEASNRKRSIIGTLLWLPPEVINKEDKLSSVVDIWSLGITIIEMAEGQPPYNKLDQGLALTKIKDLDLASPTFKEPDSWPRDLVDLLGQCLTKDASQRKCAQDLVNHDVFRSLPPRSAVKMLVSEVVSKSTKRLEFEPDLCHEIDTLLRENSRLFGLYQHRKKKVIRVDELNKSLNLIKSEFTKIQSMMETNEFMISDLRRDLNFSKDEVFSLERERNELSDHLELLKRKKIDRIKCLEEVHSKLERLEAIADIQRRKLRSLEAYSK